MEYTNFIPELIVGIILLVFALAFKSWAGTVERGSNKILDRLDTLGVELHAHRIETENRVTRVETKHESLQKQVDRIATTTGTNGSKKSTEIK